jgi:hypothetical protein
MNKTKTPRTGRPSSFTQEMADAICERLCEGEPFRAICRDEGMPAWRTVYDWMKVHKEFSAHIACAREEGFDAIAERARQTARGKTNKAGGDSSGDVQRDKLIIETDLKLLAKWDPKRYGDSMTHRGDPAAPVQLVLSGSDVHG